MTASGLSGIALQILKASSGNSVLYVDQIDFNMYSGTEVVHRLRQNGIPMNPTLDGGFQITAEVRLRLALLVLQTRTATVYEISRYLDWKEFETLASRIFEENEYFVYQNYRFTLRKKRNEIDVVAIKSPLIIVADAKHYSATGRGSIKQAISAQKERAERLAHHITEASTGPFSGRKITAIIPLIITWLEESFRIYEHIAIVPIFKLNTFLISLDHYKSQLHHVSVGYRTLDD